MVLEIVYFWHPNVLRASTSQILGNNECIEPTPIIFILDALVGEFVVINKHLIKDLFELGICNESLKNEIIRNNGSVQNIEVIPDNIKATYKTVWEIGNKALINMAAIPSKIYLSVTKFKSFYGCSRFPKIIKHAFLLME